MKKIFTLIVMLAATLGMQAQDTWAIVGQTALVGSNWDPADATNVMMSSNPQTYTLVKEGVMLKAKDYEYKAAKNGGWDDAYPAEGNQTVTITEDGEYKLEFVLTLDPSNWPASLTCTPTKTGEYVAPVGETSWTVAGVPELCTSSWDPADTGNDMVTTDQKTYTWSRTDLPLEKNTPYGFKVCANHSWDEAYGGAAGGQASDNYEIKVDKNGEYDVTITFDSEATTINVQVTYKRDHEFGEKTWTVAGANTDIFGTAWDPTNTANDMTKVAEGEYNLVKTNIALLGLTEYEYKVCANHAWTEAYGNETGGNQKFTVDEDGNYDITFVFMTETKTVDASAEISSGIEAVKVLIQKSAPIYNLQGQRISGNYRGIAIQNGKKVVVK